MSTSTLPKSIQAQMSNDTNRNAPEGSQNRIQAYRDFVERVKQMPDDFLRIPFVNYSQDVNTTITPTRAPPMLSRETPLVDMIDISVVEATLVKNYGLLRMDLYCKIRVGHMVCETQTCLNGAKNPKWDGIYQFSLKPGIDSFHLEIYDEKQFSLDEKIAWLHEPLPQEIFHGVTVEKWFPLTGRLGTNKEGSILLVLSHKRVPLRASNFSRAIGLPPSRGGPPLTVYVPAGNHPPMIGPPGPVPMDNPGLIGQPQLDMTQQQVTQQQVSEPRPLTEQDINQLSEMFPSIDKAIIRAVLENNQNDKEAAIGALLAMG